MNPTTFLPMLTQVLDEVNRISLPGPGFTRPSYSDEESRAHECVAGICEALGLKIRRDPAGNLFARLPGRDPSLPAVHIGSHLDTVRQGGAYDGTAGVAAAVALAAWFVERGQPPQADVIVTVIRAEESVWFPVSYAGSRMALGQLHPEELEARRGDTGRTLAEHMREQGFDPDAIRGLTPLRKARFVEVHIEQGPVLSAAGDAFALVTGIRGGLRYRTAQIHGAWAHSGAAPRAARADSVFAFADLVTALDSDWAETLARGDDLAVTFGIVDAAGPLHAMAKVPGELGFCLDLRSGDKAILERTDAKLAIQIAGIEAQRPGIRFALGPQSRSIPAQLSAVLLEGLRQAALALHRRPPEMLSGGGHDAAAFAAAGWDAAMLFVRNEHGSHNPDEAMHPQDLAEAVAVLAHWLNHKQDGN